MKVMAFREIGVSISGMVAVPVFKWSFNCFKNNWCFTCMQHITNK
jgi:hypothetical protein